MENVKDILKNIKDILKNIDNIESVEDANNLFGEQLSKQSNQDFTKTVTIPLNEFNTSRKELAFLKKAIEDIYNAVKEGGGLSFKVYSRDTYIVYVTSDEVCKNLITENNNLIKSRTELEESKNKIIKDTLNKNSILTDKLISIITHRDSLLEIVNQYNNEKNESIIKTKKYFWNKWF